LLEIDSSNNGCAAHKIQNNMPYNRFTKREESVTSGFGWRKHPITGLLQHHNGIDTSSPENTKVEDAEPSTSEGVINNWTDSLGGNIASVTYRRLKKRLQIHHNNSFRSNSGDKSFLGMLISLTGKTGNVTGPHAHWELHEGADIQPNGVIPKDKKGKPIDPTPFIFQGPQPTMPQDQTSSKFVTVQDGWGLSNVAKAAGLPNPGSPDTWAYVYHLNPGYRGATDWDSLNKRMGSGDILRVRPDDQTPAPPQPVDQRDQKIIDLQTKLAAANEAARLANEAAKLTESEMNAKLAEEREIQQAQINDAEIKHQQEVLNMKGRLAEIEKGMNIDVTESIRKIEEKTGIFKLILGSIITKWGDLVDRYFSGTDYLGLPGWFIRGQLKYNAPVVFFGIVTYLSTRIPLHLVGVEWNPAIESALGIFSAGIGFVAKDIASQFYDTNKDGKIDLDDLKTITN